MNISAIQGVKDEINPHLPTDYELKYMIAEGSMGAIYTAVSHESGLFLAVKTVKTIGDFQLKEKIIQEFRIQKKVSHPNIGSVFGYKDTGLYTIIFMELLTGGDLFDLIPVGKGINMLKGFNIYTGLLDAVEYCHSRGIVHMDIKPENVMISSKGRAKLIDFGLAVDHNVVPFIKGYLGTFAYSAPETFTNGTYTGYKSDIFSLNITFLTIITGERCWSKAIFEDVYYRDWYSRQWNRDVFNRIPADLLNFLMLALAHDPSLRLTIEEIRQHKWFKSASSGKMKALKSPTKILIDREVPKSQPLITNIEELFGCYDIPLSQPVDLSSILMPEVENDVQIVKRMTRFFSKKNASETLHILVIVIGQQQHCKITNHSSNCLTVELSSSNVTVLFRIFVYPFGGSILVDFRRIKGDGLLFRNGFVSMKNAIVQLGLECTDNSYLKKLRPME